MPLYEYQCGRCGRFELIRKFSDAPLEACPTCGQEVQKLLSAPAIQFKGTGWYITDYARKSSGSESGKEGKEGKEGKGKAASGTDGGSKDAGSDKGASAAAGSGSGSSDTSSAASKTAKGSGSS